MKKSPLLFVAPFALIIGSLSLDAGSLITDPGIGNFSSSSGGYMAGASFDVGSFPLEITALGLFDSGEPGFIQSHEIGIWNASSWQLLAQVNLSSGLSGVSENGFRYQSLDDYVMLDSGTRYIIAAFYPDPALDQFQSNSSLTPETWSPHVTPYNLRYAFTEAFSFPSLQAGGMSYVGPNAQFTVIPEPAASPALIAGGTLIVLLWQAQRRARARRYNCDGHS